VEQYFIYLSVVLSIIIFVPLYRVVRGPTLFDRMLGASAIGSKTLVLICIIGVVYGRIDMFIDITLAYAVLNFVAVIAISRYLRTVEAKE
jgi:multicomponent Na+:H+ antiporter subunit F